MKKARRVLLIVTIVCGALALIVDIAAVAMQIQVAGENLLTMDSHWGYILAVSYRWVTLAAVVLTVTAAGLLTAFLLTRKKDKKTSEPPVGSQTPPVG